MDSLDMIINRNMSEEDKFCVQFALDGLQSSYIKDRMNTIRDLMVFGDSFSKDLLEYFSINDPSIKVSIIVVTS